MKFNGSLFKDINKNRLILLLVGFSLLVIPLILFSYELNNYYLLTKNKIDETLTKLAFNQAKKLKNNITPFNYLKNEFSKIHSDLIPDFPDEIIRKIPNEEYIDKIYSKDLFEKILSLTKNKFNPIIITLGTNNLTKTYAYCSEDLKKEFLSKKNEKEFLEAKDYFDIKRILINYKLFFEKKAEPSIYYKELDFKSEKQYSIYSFDDIFFKYYSRYSYYDPLSPIYTDYFDKQTLYPIIKYTISPKGVHGFYSLIIPQSHIDPYSIIDSILSEKDNIKIELVDNKKPSSIIKTPKGIEFRCDFPTAFIVQIKAFNKLRGIDRSDILSKQIKISIDYPKDLLSLEETNNIVKLSQFIGFPIYLLFIYFFIKIIKIKLSLTKKIVFILFTLIFIPIFGTCIYIIISAHNLELFITQNISKNLHNTLESYSYQDQENNLRFIASILNIKKKIINQNLNSKWDNLYNNFLTKEETKSWYKTWFNGLISISSNNDFCCFDDNGINLNNSNRKAKQTEQRFYKFILKRYLNNLSLSNTFKSDNFEEIISLGVIEDYYNKETEEASIPLEAIPHKDYIKLSDNNDDTSIIFYSKNKDNTHYLFYTKKTSSNVEPYFYINKYIEKVNPLCFNPYNKYAIMNLAFIINNSHKNNMIILPSPSIINSEISDIIYNFKDSKNSSNEIIEIGNEHIIKERMAKDNNPFILIGLAKINNKSYIELLIIIIFVILLIYAVILLAIFTDFISIFINKPINIYKEAIEYLENKHYGTTIASFSKDEFYKITNAFNKMSIAIRQKEDIKRFVSDRLIQSVEGKNIQKIGNGKIEKVTILSSDIRNFTGISEKYEPSEIVEMLNSYFTKMQQAITENGGIIDKYIGDAIQAVFYDDNQVLRAIKAALNMREALKDFNNERRKNNLFTIENGIGIDTDEAITGTIGTENGRKDFSVNGKVIARAAELEAKTKNTNSKILISRQSLGEIYNKNTTYHSEASALIIPNITYKDFDEKAVEIINVR